MKRRTLSRMFAVVAMIAAVLVPAVSASAADYSCNGIPYNPDNPLHVLYGGSVDTPHNASGHLMKVHLTGTTAGRIVFWDGSYSVEGGNTATGAAIKGSNQDDTICGTDGADRIKGRKGADEVFGGAGGDRIKGGGGQDHIDGGFGADVIWGQGNADVIRGGSGADSLGGNNGNDTLYGGDGADVITGGDGADTVYGEAGDDSIYGGEGSDILVGGDGDDAVYANDANSNGKDIADKSVDSMEGSNGSDTLYGNCDEVGSQDDSAVDTGSSGTDTSWTTGNNTGIENKHNACGGGGPPPSS